MTYGGSNDDVIDGIMTLKGQGRDPNIFKARYLKNGSRLRLGYKGTPLENGMCGTEWSRDWWLHVTQIGQSRDLVIVGCKYLENGLS